MTPALLTRMSSRPSRSTVSATARADVAAHRHVRSQGQPPPPEGLDGGQRVVRGCQVDRRHVGTGARERFGDGSADAPRAAGHQRHAPAQVRRGRRTGGQRRERILLHGAHVLTAGPWPVRPSLRGDPRDTTSSRRARSGRRRVPSARSRGSPVRLAGWDSRSSSTRPASSATRSAALLARAGAAGCARPRRRADPPARDPRRRRASWRAFNAQVHARRRRARARPAGRAVDARPDCSGPTRRPAPRTSPSSRTPGPAASSPRSF